MGMFSEMANEQFAKDLQVTLLAAAETGSPEIIRFCGEFVWPLYQVVAEEGHVTIPIIIHERFSGYNESIERFRSYRKRLERSDGLPESG